MPDKKPVCAGEDNAACVSGFGLSRDRSMSDNESQSLKSNVLTVFRLAGKRTVLCFICLLFFLFADDIILSGSQKKTDAEQPND